MSNWVYNQLSVEGPEKDVHAFVDAVKGCSPKGYVSFERDLLKVIEQIGHSSNWIEADQEIQRQRNQIKDRYVPQEVHFVYGESLNGEFLEFIPSHLLRQRDEKQKQAALHQWSSSIKRNVQKRERDPKPPRQHFSLHQLVPIPEEALDWSFHFLGKKIQSGLWGTQKDVGHCSKVSFVPSNKKTTRAFWTFSSLQNPPLKAIVGGSENWPSLLFALSWCQKEHCGGRQLWKEGIAFHKKNHFKSIEIPSTFIQSHSEEYTNSEGTIETEVWNHIDVARVLQWQNNLLFEECALLSPEEFERKRKIKKRIPMLSEMGSLISLLQPDNAQFSSGIAKEAREILQMGGDLEPIEDLIQKLKTLYRTLRNPSF